MPTTTPAGNTAALTSAAAAFRATQAKEVNPKLLVRNSALTFVGGPDAAGAVTGDVAVAVGARILLQSADLTWHALAVSNAGVLTTTLVAVAP